MGRKPTPTHQKILTGNPGKRPLPKGEPIVREPLGAPPADFKPAARVLWHEVANAIPEGVATRADTLLLELTVRLLIRMRTVKVADLTPALASQIRNCLACFGMTPADRARVSIEPAPSADDPAEKYMRDD